ncbi:MAG: hypothetical protein ABI658_16830 [Acidimicrobiales bacterium]
MASTTEFPPHTANGHTPTERRRWTRGRIAVAAWILIVIGFWIYAFFLAPKGSPDILDVPAFASASETRCAQSRTVIDALPNASTAKSATERADVIDRANQELRDMLDDISVLPTGTEHDTNLIGLWLKDWRQYVVDRGDFSQQLRVNPAATFGVTARNGSHITKAIDAFAGRNKMPSCEVPTDV